MFVFIQRLFANVLFANLPFSAKITVFSRALYFRRALLAFSHVNKTQYTYSIFNVSSLYRKKF
jgi:hypothetical protein